MISLREFTTINRCYVKTVHFTIITRYRVVCKTQPCTNVYNVDTPFLYFFATPTPVNPIKSSDPLTALPDKT